MVIYLDFDGTVVEHEYPKIGRPNPYALDVIQKLQQAGHDIVLNTMRSEFADNSLMEAMDYLNNNRDADISITRFTNSKIHPHLWNPATAKVQLFIDDIASDIPLIPAVRTSGEMVDWLMVQEQLVTAGIL